MLFKVNFRGSSQVFVFHLTEYSSSRVEAMMGNKGSDYIFHTVDGRRHVVHREHVLFASLG